MTIEIIISSAVVGAIVTGIGNIIAAKIAQKTATKAAKETASSEIEKMQLTWNREDLVSSDDEFADMANDVARFIHSGNYPRQSEALGKVAAVRSKESGEIGSTLDVLYDAIRKGDRNGADAALAIAISQKRDLKAQRSITP